MRSFKLFILLSLGAATATAETGFECSSPSVTTMYITVPASTVTETVYATTPISSSEADNTAITPTLTLTRSITQTIYVSSSTSPSGSADAASDRTLTVTKSQISTQVIQVFQASSPTGPYSFTEENGTTIWLGGQTPPVSASFTTSTTIVTLQPVASAASEGTTTSVTVSYVTIFSTLTVTQVHTQTLTEALSVTPVPVRSPIGHGYTGYGSAGWNTTLTTFLKLKAKPTGTQRASPSMYVGGAAGKISLHQEAVSASPTPSINSTLPIERRQVGEVVVATIEGVVVLWTNSWGGETPTSKAPTSTAPTSTAPTSTAPTSKAQHTPHFVGVTATAPPFGEDVSSTISPFSSMTKIDASPATAPTTTVGIYPWDTVFVSNGVSYQPGLVPRPSVSTSNIASLLSAIFSTRSTPLATSIRVSSGKLTSASTTVAPTATAAASSCSEASAEFTVDFDDLPSFSTGPDDTDIPPIFNPYRKLYWEGHFGYVPPPTDPFPPHSPPQLAVYRADGPNFNSSTGAGLQSFGGVGSGPRAEYSAYWFDAFSAWLGCASGGPNECTITITGHTRGGDNLTQTVTEPPCPGLKNCSLQLVNLDAGFRNLTALNIVATIGGMAVDWYMDDLELGWSDNTCAAQLTRSSSE